MDQLAALRREQANRYMQHRANNPAPMDTTDKSSDKSKKKGKVICGKWFLDPPNCLRMQDMEKLLNVYVRISPPKERRTEMVKMDMDSAEFFQSFLQRASFQHQRFGLMFGTVNEKEKSITVDCIYEPAQSGGQAGFVGMDDPILESVIVLAKHLGFVPVGWIFSHLPNREKYVLSAAEVLKTAELTSKFGPHCVVVRVTQIPESRQTDFSPYEVSSQLVEIYKEGTLSPHPSDEHLVHSERELEAVTEEQSTQNKPHIVRQPSHDVDTTLFIIPIPISSHTSTVRNRFSRINRPDHAPSMASDVQTLLQSRAREEPHQILNDFHLLVFLIKSGQISEADIPLICSSIRAKSNTPLQPLMRKLQSHKPSSSSNPPRTTPAPPSQPITRPSPAARGNDDKVREIMAICHCDETSARNALAAAGGDINEAISYLVY